jgi:hypothetical protein
MLPMQNNMLLLKRKGASEACSGKQTMVCQCILIKAVNRVIAGHLEAVKALPVAGSLAAIEPWPLCIVPVAQGHTSYYEPGLQTS